jgi:hypothetical protein
VLIQLFPPDDERLSLETCRGGKINTLKKVKKGVKLVENPQMPQDARSTEYKKPSAYFPPSMSATKIHTHTGRRAKIILLYILIFKAG